MTNIINREHALELLNSNVTEAHLIQHSLASEAVMCALARHLGEDENIWGLTGLLHDLDYNKTAQTPEIHGLMASEMLENKLPVEAREAICAHNGEMNGTSPKTKLDYALRCGESVTGLIVTAALVRPTGITGMETKSLKKKMKDKAFAASVSRENIKQCSELDIELDVFLRLSIDAMSTHALELNIPTEAKNV